MSWQQIMIDLLGKNWLRDSYSVGEIGMVAELATFREKELSELKEVLREAKTLALICSQIRDEDEADICSEHSQAFLEKHKEVL